MLCVSVLEFLVMLLTDADCRTRIVRIFMEIISNSRVVKTHHDLEGLQSCLSTLHARINLGSSWGLDVYTSLEILHLHFFGTKTFNVIVFQFVQEI